MYYVCLEQVLDETVSLIPIHPRALLLVIRTRGPIPYIGTCTTIAGGNFDNDDH